MSASRDLKMDWSDGAAWDSRGVGGLRRDLGCFVTGEPPAHEFRQYLSAFVENEDAGVVIVGSMFNGQARLHREGEATYTVSVGVAKGHEDALIELGRLTEANGNMITPAIIKAAREFSLSRQAPAPTRL